MGGGGGQIISPEDKIDEFEKLSYLEDEGTESNFGEVGLKRLDELRNEIKEALQFKQRVKDWLKTREERFKQFCEEDKKLGEKYPYLEDEERHADGYWEAFSEISERLNFGSTEKILERLLKEEKP